MKFSLRLNNDLPVRDYVRYAQAAEAAGFDQFWVSNDLFLRSAPVILTAVAIATERIEIGSCILNPFTIHPAEIAMFAVTLDELSGGRFNLGISSGAEDFMRWLGMEFRHPRTRVLEAIAAINKLTSNQNAAVAGLTLQWTEEAWLRFQSRRRVPIYLGAMSPRMLEEIGAVADGGLPLLFPPEHYANVLPYVQRGLARSGRMLDDIDLAACIWCSVSTDRAAAEAMLADKIAYYGHAMSPLMLRQLGLTPAGLRHGRCRSRRTRWRTSQTKAATGHAPCRRVVSGCCSCLHARLRTHASRCSIPHAPTARRSLYPRRFRRRPRSAGCPR